MGPFDGAGWRWRRRRRAGSGGGWRLPRLAAWPIAAAVAAQLASGAAPWDGATAAVGGVSEAGSPISPTALRTRLATEVLGSPSAAAVAEEPEEPIGMDAVKLRLALEVSGPDNQSQAEGGGGKVSAGDTITMVALRLRLLSTYLTIEDAFQRMSRYSARLDRMSFVDAMQMLARPVGDPQAEYAFASLDANRDGYVEEHEFVQMLEPSAGGRAEFVVDGWLAGFESEFGEAFGWRGWMEKTFGALDADADGSVLPVEFVRAAQRFANPPSTEQAELVFYQIDDDHSGSLQLRELRDAVAKKIGTDFEEATVGLEEYRRRVAVAEVPGGALGVEVHIPGVDLKGLEPFTRGSVERVAALFLATVARSDVQGVRDDTGASGATMMSALDAWASSSEGVAATGGDVEESGVVIRAAVRIGSGAFSDSALSSADLVRAIGQQTDALADEVSDLLGVAAKNITAAPLAAPWVAFVAGDSNGDKVLDAGEFTALAAALRPPLTARQAKYVFSGLDADIDGRLNTTEFSAEGLGDFFVPPFTGRQLPFQDFHARMLRRYASAQEAFDSATMSMPVTVGPAFAHFCRTLRPPLTAKQARYAFEGFDVDGDGGVSNIEFLEVTRFGSLFPSNQQLQDMLAYRVTEPWQAVPSVPDFGGSVWALGAAPLLLGAYLARSLFIALRLPGALGAFVAGWGLAKLGPEALDLAAGPLEDLRPLAASLLLFVAGFGVSAPDLSAGAAARAVLPPTFELAGATLFGIAGMGLPILQAIVLGAAVCGVGEAPVAAMLQGVCQSPDARGAVPRAIVVSLPVETSFVLAQWGVLRVLATLSHRQGLSVLEFLVAAGVSICASLAAGALTGVVAGVLASRRSVLSCFGRKPFSGKTAETALLVAATAWAGHCVSVSNLPALVATTGFRVGAAAFVPELVLLAAGGALAAHLPPRDLEAADSRIGPWWILGQLVLFATFGREAASAGWGTQDQQFSIMCLMLCGLSMRFLGLFVVNIGALASPSCSCPKCRSAGQSSLMSNTVFCLLASLPRTALQAFCGLGGIAAAPAAGSLLSTAVRLSLVGGSILGPFLLEVFGPTLLHAGGETCEEAEEREGNHAALGWSHRQRTLLGSSSNAQSSFFRIGLVSQHGHVLDDPSLPSYPAKHAVDLLAQAYVVDPAAFEEILRAQESAAASGRASARAQHDPFTSSAYVGYASIRDMASYAAGIADDGFIWWRSSGQGPQETRTSARGFTTTLGLGAGGPEGRRPPPGAGTVARRLAEECAIPMSLFEASAAEARGSQGDGSPRSSANRRV